MPLIKLLHKPHPFIFTRFSVLLPAGLTFGLLVTLRPFEFERFSWTELLMWSFIFSLIVALSIWSMVALFQKYAAQTLEERWTVGREMLLTVAVLAVIMLLVTLLFMAINPAQNFTHLWQMVFVRTVLISVFPLAFLVMYEQYHHQKLKTREAEQLNQKLLQRPERQEEPKSKPRKLIIRAENQKLVLQVEPEEVIYVKSEGNYVDVFYLGTEGLTKEVIRASLKAIEEQLSTPNFFRCHKSHLVNLEHIQKVQGNARNLELILSNVSSLIPVSRNKSKALLERLQVQH